MTNGGRRTRRFLIGALVIAIVVVGGGMIALRMILTPERLRAETIRRTSAATGLAVELDAASLSFLPFGVEIQGLRVAAPDPTEPPLLSLRSGLVRLQLWALLSRNVVVERIELDGPVVSVSDENLAKQAESTGDRTEPGERSAPRSGAATRGAAFLAGALRGAIERLEVTDGAVRLRTADGSSDVAAGGIHLRARLEATEGANEIRAEGEISLRELDVATLSPYREALDALRPSARFAATLYPLDGRLEVGEMKFVSESLGKSGLTVRGVVEDLRRPKEARFDLQADADIDLADVSRAGLLAEGVEMSGRLQAEVGGRGTFDRPVEAEISGKATLEGLGVRTSALPVPLSDGVAHAVLNGGDVELESITLKAGRSHFTGQGRIEHALAQPHFVLRGHSERLDLTEWMPVPGDPPGNAPSADGDRRAPATANPPLVPPLPPVTADVVLEVDSLVTADAALSDAKLTIALADGIARVEGRVRSGQFGRGVRMTDLTANVSIQGQTMRGTFRSPRVEAHRVPLTELQGRLDLGEDRRLRISKATAVLWTGRVEGDAVVDLTNAAEPAFTIDTRAVDLEANDFVSGLTPARDFLFGRLDIRSSFSGRGITPDAVAASLVGNGDVTARNGRLNRGPQTQAIWNALQLGERESIPFGDLATAFSVKQGRLMTRDLSLAGRDAAWHGSGSVGFDGDLDYALAVELSEELSGLFRSRVGSDLGKLLGGTSGRIVLDLDVGGNVKRPTVRLDRDRLAKRAAANAKDALQEELKKGKNRLGDALKDLLGGKK